MTVQVSPELKRYQHQTNQALALKSVLQIVDRALAGVPDLSVNIVDQNLTYHRVPAPAWTDGKKISMDKEMILKVFEEQDLPSAILTFKGTNYHELAHVLFTPRKNDAIGQWIMKNSQYRWSWNALEDQRIETLFTALYVPSVPYFRNSSYRWLLNETVGTDSFYRVYSLIGGRKYLDRSVRRTARQAFVDHYGAQVADDLDRVVNEYVGLPLPGFADRAMELVKEFYELLGTTPDLFSFLNRQGQCGGHGASKDGEVDPERAVEAAVRVREQLEDEAEQDAADGPQTPASQAQEDDEDGAEGGDAPAPSAGDQDDDDFGDFPWEEDEDDEDSESQDGGGDAGAAGQDEASDEAEDGSEGDSQDDSDGPAADGKGGKGAGHGNSPPPPAPTKDSDLQDAINEALADTLTDEGLKEDLDSAVNAFKAHAAGKGEAELQQSYDNFVEVDAADDTVQTVQQIVAQLRKLRTDAEATWIKERITGSRVNVNHVIRNQADATHMEVFEQWDEGYEEEAKTEVVIAIDLSGSMDSVLPKCSEALWALKKSFDKVDVPTTVLGFSHGNVVLYGKNEKLRNLKLRRFHYWSGTEARETMLYAHRLLCKSQATNKVLIAITDGAWYDDDQPGINPEDAVADLRKRGASTLLFGVNGHRVQENEHNFEQCSNITEIGDIVKIIKELVFQIQEKAGRNKR